MKKLLILIMLFPTIVFCQITTLKSGNVGIGTTTPSEKLEVNGNIKCDTITSKGGKIQNRYTVGANGDFSTIKSAVDWLSIPTHMTDNTELTLGAGSDYLITDGIHIELSYELVIRGMGNQVTILKAHTGLTGKTVFECYSNLHLYNIGFDGTNLTNWGDLANEIFIETHGSSTYFDVVGCRISTAHIGFKASNAAEIHFNNNVVEDCIDEAFGIYNATTTKNVAYEITGNEFKRNNKAIEFVDGDSLKFRIEGNAFGMTTGDTAIYFVAGGVTTKQPTVIINNTFSGVANALIGLDFSTAAAANIYVRGNANLDDKSASGDFEVLASTNLTTITTANTWTKLTWDAYDIQDIIKLASTGVNNVSYISDNITNLTCQVALSIQVDNGQPSTVEIGIVKNGVFNGDNELTSGTVRCPQEIRFTVNDQSENVVSFTTFYGVAKNDVFTIVARNTKKEDLRVTRLNGNIKK